MNKFINTYLSIFVLFLLTTSILYGQNQKKVLVEQLSGAWCGLCPGGYVIMDSLLSNENVIGVSLHLDDPMEIFDGKNLSETYAAGGVPSFLLDRYLFSSTPFVSFGIEKTAIDSNVLKRLSEPAEVLLSFEEITYNEEAQEVMIEVEANFQKNLPEGDYRFNLYVVERSVYKDDPDYWQVSYYNDLEGHPYENLGNTITDFNHKNVVSAMLGGTWGVPGSIPTSNIQEGDLFNHTFTLDWNSAWEPSNVDFIALIQEYTEEDVNQRSILNSNITYFNDWLIGETGIEQVNTELPAYYDFNSQSIQVKLNEPGNYELRLFNTNGQLLKELTNEPSANSLSTNGLLPGIYFLNIQTDTEIFSGSICIF